MLKVQVKPISPFPEPHSIFSCRTERVGIKSNNVCICSKRENRMSETFKKSVFLIASVAAAVSWKRELSQTPSYLHFLSPTHLRCTVPEKQREGSSPKKKDCFSMPRCHGLLLSRKCSDEGEEKAIMSTELLSKSPVLF